MGTIDFYDKKDKYWEFSNYYVLPKGGKFLIDGKEYTSTEHYYQSMKFHHGSQRSFEYAERIRNVKTPDMSRILANQKKQGGYKWKTDLNVHIEEYKDVTFDEERWNSIKDTVMRRAIYQKFSRHSHLRELLLSTSTSILRENSPRDPYWGVGKDGKGKNMLGKILQEVRYILSGGKLLSHNIPQPSFEKSHWIIPGILLASAYPGSKDSTHTSIIQGIEDMGMNAFVSLQTHDELKGFASYDSDIASNLTKRDVCYIGTSKRYSTSLFFSILEVVDRKSVSSDALAVDMCDGVCLLIDSEKKVVLHCFGGKGRTGLMSCLIFGKLYGMSAEEAMQRLQSLYDNCRKNKGRAIGKIPQTAVQRKQVERILKDSYNEV